MAAFLMKADHSVQRIFFASFVGLLYLNLLQVSEARMFWVGPQENETNAIDIGDTWVLFIIAGLESKFLFKPNYEYRKTSNTQILYTPIFCNHSVRNISISNYR